MTIADDRAEALSAARPDRFARVRQEAFDHAAAHGCDAFPASALKARELAVLVRAMHATYALELRAGLGYSALHIASSFGHTGHLDAIERDRQHAELASSSIQRYAMGEHVRLHRGEAGEILPALSGPYDVAVLDGPLAEAMALYEHIVRLVRTGGSIISWPGDDDPASAELLARMAGDDRLLATFGPGLRAVLAVRIR